MTIRTITFDDEQWQVVPKKMAPVMWHAAIAAHDAIGAWVAALAVAPEPPAQEPHPDDVAVDAFAAAMKSKLAEARAKGRGGWQDKKQCSQQYLSTLLRDHVRKGDPRDVANFCCFLWNRAEGIAPAPAQEPMTDDEIEALMLTTPDDLFEWVRQVERHHGIGKGESNA